MNTQLIITHPGSAHFDEVTALSLILAVHSRTEFKIERRVPTSAELENPKVWVVDIGDRHEPEKHNFDHHQSLDCLSSFRLVAEYLGIAEMLSVQPWWKFKDSVDRFGATKSSVWFKAGDELVNRNPMEEWLIHYFADNPQSALPILRSYGSFLIRDSRRLKKQIDFWKTCPKMMIAGVLAIIGENTESIGLEEFRRIAEDPPDIVISLDRRSPGWRLFRYDGTPVDFSRIAHDPAIAFAHKSGFMAKTKKRLDMPALIALVSQAIISD